MKRAVAKYLIILSAVCLLGLMPFPINGQQLVEYCSLFNPVSGGKVVTSSALMSYSTIGRVDGGDVFLYSGACNSTDYFAIPRDKPKVWDKWRRFFNNLPPERNLILEIKFEGKPDVETAFLFGSLDGWARAQMNLLSISSIKDISSLSNAVLPDYKASKPEVDRVNQLKNTLKDFLESLYAPSGPKYDVEDSLSDEFRFIDSSRKTFNKDQYLKLEAPRLGAYQSLKDLKITYELRKRTKESVIFRGNVKLRFANNHAKTIRCDMTFMLRNGNWILGRAEIVQGKGA